MATLAVMYTLKRSEAQDGSPRLLGPLNRRVYASFAPKRHAFAIARREADKRGFTTQERTEMMKYHELAAQDLELSSGIVEGAVRYVIAQRFDEGGMRWIKTRAETLLQLRCIEVNGDWERFVQFVHHRIAAEQSRKLRQPRLLRKRPKPLPVLGLRDES